MNKTSWQLLPHGADKPGMAATNDTFPEVLQLATCLKVGGILLKGWQGPPGGSPGRRLVGHSSAGRWICGTRSDFRTSSHLLEPSVLASCRKLEQQLLVDLTPQLKATRELSVPQARASRCRSLGIKTLLQLLLTIEDLGRCGNAS